MDKKLIPHHFDDASLESARQHFQKFLRTKELKLTGQRDDVLVRAAHMTGHFTADDMVDAFAKRKTRPSKATVYRTLSLLTACKVLEEHAIARRSSSVYEFAWGRDHHDHLICTVCGTIIEFMCQEIEDLQDNVAERHGFTAEFHSQKIYGTCRKCHSRT